MERVAIDDAGSPAAAGDGDRHGLTDPLGTTDVAINFYRLAPGDRISSLHAHADQEEIFLCVDGELGFETLAGEITVNAGEAVRFAPGEFQSGKNDSDGEAAALAIGAPRDSEDIRVPLPCPECGHEDRRVTVGDDGPVLACPDCGDESAANCPDCGSDDVSAVLSDEGETPVSVCGDCGAEWAAGQTTHRE